MVDIKMSRTIENPNLDAEAWDLYSFEAKLTQHCARAAQRLNETFTASVNEGKDRNDVRRDVNKIQTMFSNTGADDSEPHHVLENLLDKVFGPE